MIPIILGGHSKSITKIIYNRDGDLLFSGGRDKLIYIWFINDCSRLGTIVEDGAIIDMDVDFSSERLLCVNGDCKTKVIDVETGRTLHVMEESKVQCRFCSGRYSVNGKLIFVSRWGKTCQIYDNKEAVASISCGSRVTSGVFCMCDQQVILGDETGLLSLWDLRTNKIVETSKGHSELITDLQPHPRLPLFLSGSKDHSAKLYDYNLTHLCTYSSDKPVNSVSISSLMPHVVLAGGQEAQDVTVTAHEEFLARFYHIANQEQLANFGGHFGPINSIAFHPNGLSYSTAGHDGSIHTHHFGQDYLSMKYPGDEVLLM